MLDMLCWMSGESHLETVHLLFLGCVPRIALSEFIPRGKIRNFWQRTETSLSWTTNCLDRKFTRIIVLQRRSFAYTWGHKTKLAVGEIVENASPLGKGNLVVTEISCLSRLLGVILNKIKVMICNFEFLLLITIMGASPRDLMNADDEFISYGNVIGDGPILFVHLYTIISNPFAWPYSTLTK